MKEKFELIEKCIETGNWEGVGDIITRNDMMDYLMNLKDTSTKSTNLVCPLCDSNLKANKFTLTHRGVKFLMMLGKLTKRIDGRYDYIHYEEVQKETKKHFGVSFTSYGLLHAWKLIEPMKDSNDKTKRNGYWKITPRGVAFLNGRVSVAETVHILNGRIIKESHNKVNVVTIKKVNFQETVDYLKSF